MGCCTACDTDKTFAPLPRFTTLIGGSSFTSEPIAVSGKESLSLQVWRGPLIGSTPEIEFFFDQSLDGEHWTPISETGFDPGTDVVKTLDFCVDLKWFRVRVETSSDTQVTCWAEGIAK